MWYQDLSEGFLFSSQFPALHSVTPEVLSMRSKGNQELGQREHWRFGEIMLLSRREEIWKGKGAGSRLLTVVSLLHQYMSVAFAFALHSSIDTCPFSLILH